MAFLESFTYLLISSFTIILKGLRITPWGHVYPGGEASLEYHKLFFSGELMRVRIHSEPFDVFSVKKKSNTNNK